MTGQENIIKNLEICASGCCEGCTYYKPGGMNLGCWNKLMSDAAKLLKEQEAQEVPGELKQQMWNALYAEEDKFERKYVNTEEHDSWFFVYRLWLQKGFNLAIKAIADWEER